ncbi:MAG: hypothetical protein U0869_19675 [Chloroflexota bacterium]
MARDELLTESSERILELSASEAEALRATGRRLASSKTWWGAGATDDEPPIDRTVIRVREVGDGRWSVRVADAVGVVSVGSLQITVLPKIPLDHLLYLFARSSAVPRPDEQKAAVSADRSLWDLVAAWFVGAFERLLRGDLIRDYQETAEDLTIARGRIETSESTKYFYGGRLELHCTHDDFALDTPLNRVLLAASRLVASRPTRDPKLRQRALRLMARSEGVGDLQSSDLAAMVDRRTAHYRDALALARTLLTHSGRTVSSGQELGWTFLMRTPDLVESGILGLLQDALGPATVIKTKHSIPNSAITFSPDLVFDRGRAVGDVKYKLSVGDWVRQDLYQAIAFAEAFQVEHALIVRFRDRDVPSMPATTIGRKVVSEATWPLRPGLSPVDAAAELVQSVTAWLASVPVTRESTSALVLSSR